MPLQTRIPGRNKRDCFMCLFCSLPVTRFLYGTGNDPDQRQHLSSNLVNCLQITLTRAEVNPRDRRLSCALVFFSFDYAAERDFQLQKILNGGSHFSPFSYQTQPRLLSRAHKEEFGQETWNVIFCNNSVIILGHFAKPRLWTNFSRLTST